MLCATQAAAAATAALLLLSGAGPALAGDAAADYERLRSAAGGELSLSDALLQRYSKVRPALLLCHSGR